MTIAETLYFCYSYFKEIQMKQFNFLLYLVNLLQINIAFTKFSHGKILLHHYSIL